MSRGGGGAAGRQPHGPAARLACGCRVRLEPPGGGKKSALAAEGGAVATLLPVLGMKSTPTDRRRTPVPDHCRNAARTQRGTGAPLTSHPAPSRFGGDRNLPPLSSGMIEMRQGPDFARTAALMGEPARATMLDALLGGQALPAGELARRAGISPATASEHLARLVEHGLVARRRAGRHAYYALATPEVAAALEALARAATAAGDAQAARARGRGAPAAGPDRALRFARTCYDHLAGTLGVAVTEALRGRSLVAGDALALTPAGHEWLTALGIDAAELRRGRRPLTRPCLDWTERRDHLAGAVGAALAATLLERRWVARLDGTRALRLTARGRDGLYRILQLELAGG